jgi:hypothetical protein
MKTTNTPTLQDQIQDRISQNGPGWAFGPFDFNDLADPRILAVTLGRMVTAGLIRRVAHGIYDKPHSHPILGQVGAGPDALVQAIARKRKLRVLPSTALAANQLGLTTQVPAQLVYHTDGAASTFQSGALTIQFKRNSGKLLSLANSPTGWVVQGLRAIGKDGVRPDHIRTLRRKLDTAAKQRLLSEQSAAPAWMRPHLTAIARAEVPDA